MTKIEICMSENDVKRLNRIREAMESVEKLCAETDGTYNPITGKYEVTALEYEHLCKAVDELMLAYSTYVANTVYKTTKLEKT